jgi:hypothetical protein
MKPIKQLFIAATLAALSISSASAGIMGVGMINFTTDTATELAGNFFLEPFSFANESPSAFMNLPGTADTQFLIGDNSDGGGGMFGGTLGGTVGGIFFSATPGTPNDPFIFDGENISGFYTNGAQGGTVDFSISSSINNSISNSDQGFQGVFSFVTRPTPTPESGSTLAMLGLVTAGLAGVRRRRN